MIAPEPILRPNEWYVPGTGGQAGHLRRIMHGPDPANTEDAAFLPPRPETTWEERALIAAMLAAADYASELSRLYNALEPRGFRTEPLNEIVGYLNANLRWLAGERERVYRAPGEAESTEPLDAFEAWLVERTLAAARSEAFRDTAEYEYLQAEWEQGR